MAAPAAGAPDEQDEEEAPAASAALLPGGAAPYGNFPDYSRFHPPEARVRLLPAALLGSLFPQARSAGPLLGLDVGCNSGELSLALYSHLQPGLERQEAEEGGTTKPRRTELNLLCCDIDAGLIERAERSSPFPGSIRYAALDFMDAAAREKLLGAHLARFARSGFDIAFCMSVTMWIHLNHGDGGLVKFLSCLASKCAYLLVEPQPWKCYRAAARRLRRLGRNDFDHFRALTIKGNMVEQITRILEKDCAMELVCCFGSTTWDRRLLLFKSKKTCDVNSGIPVLGWKEKRRRVSEGGLCEPDMALSKNSDS